jgi:hypothetical protein
METTRAEQPPRVRRLLPPAWIFRGAGYSASRPAHPQQYTPFTAVARSHSAPHPSHTFKSIRKPFIVPFRSVVLPRRASVFFSGRVGSPRLLASSVRQTPELYRPHRSNGVTRLFFCSVRCTTLGKIASTLHCLPPLVRMQFQPLSFTLHQDRVPHVSPSHFGKSQGYSFRQSFCQTLSSSGN